MTIDPDILNRKGARKIADIPPVVLELLNLGKIETVNLTEWLATDQLALLTMVLNDIDRSDWFEPFEIAVSSQKKITANSNVKLIGQRFAQWIEDDQIRHTLSTHTSDIVRAWACWAIMTNEDELVSLSQKAKPFAADPNSGLREVVIFATKDKLAAQLERSVAILSDWTADEDENVRRYVVEVLRPIGVWTKKIPQLQENPALGLPLIEPLKSDPSRYVQNAVANWLNDASKSQPEWVRQLCEEWTSASDSKSTQYIVKRACRTINKS